MGKACRFEETAERVALGALMLLLAGVAPVAAAEPTERNYGEKADTLGTAEPEEPEATGPNKGRVSFTVASDITTAYFFRGILQERNGFIWEPYAEMAINLFKSDGPLSSVDLGMGIWFSFQSDKTGASGSGPTNLYETDYYPSLTLGWSPGLTTSLTYLIYTSPNGAFQTVQQLDLGLAFDDSPYLGAFALNPSTTFSFEVDNTSFGDKEGGYFELALAPGVTLPFPPDPYALSLTFPLALGLSMYDYYETETSNDTFGFFSFGLNGGIPLAFIPEDFGSWTANLGINVLVLSDTLKDVNDGDNPFPVGTFSIAMQY
jgi:hypothetical protein